MRQKVDPDILAAMVDFLEVSERTARRWIACPASMPAPEAKLWRLHTEGRILPASWTGARIQGDLLTTNTGYQLTHGQVHQFAWHCKCLDHLLSDLCFLSQRVRKIENQGGQLNGADYAAHASLQSVARELETGLPDLVRNEPTRHRGQGC